MTHDPLARIAADDFARTLDFVIDTGRRAERLPDELVDPEVRALAARFRASVEAGVAEFADEVQRLRGD